MSATVHFYLLFVCCDKYTLIFTSLSPRATKKVARPLIAAEEDRTTDADPHGSRPDAAEEDLGAFFPHYGPSQCEYVNPLLRQHQSGLEYVKRRRESRGHGAR